MSALPIRITPLRALECPLLKIRRGPDQEVLRPLPLAGGGSRFVLLHVVFSNEDGAGSAVDAQVKHIEWQVASIMEDGRRKSVW